MCRADHEEQPMRPETKNDMPCVTPPDRMKTIHVMVPHDGPHGAPNGVVDVLITWFSNTPEIATVVQMQTGRATEIETSNEFVAAVRSEDWQRAAGIAIAEIPEIGPQLAASLARS
jgi:hypothetical protein